MTEAPASCCLRLRVGDLEILYTMRDVTDAELTSRVQHLVPWVQDVLDQARERQAHLDLLRQQREAASTGTAVPQPPLTPPADVQALIQQVVQQALAAQQPSSTGQATPSRHGARGHATRQPGRLVPAASGGDGAAPQCHGHLVQPLGSPRTTLLQGHLAMQPGGGRASSAPT